MDDSSAGSDRQACAAVPCRTPTLGRSRAECPGRSSVAGAGTVPTGPSAGACGTGPQGLGGAVPAAGGGQAQDVECDEARRPPGGALRAVRPGWCSRFCNCSNARRPSALRTISPPSSAVVSDSCTAPAATSGKAAAMSVPRCERSVSWPPLSDQPALKPSHFRLPRSAGEAVRDCEPRTADRGGEYRLRQQLRHLGCPHLWAGYVRVVGQVVVPDHRFEHPDHRPDHPGRARALGSLRCGPARRARSAAGLPVGARVMSRPARAFLRWVCSIGTLAGCQGSLHGGACGAGRCWPRGRVLAGGTVRKTIAPPLATAYAKRRVARDPRGM